MLFIIKDADTILIFTIITKQVENIFYVVKLFKVSRYEDIYGSRKCD